jgi:hypothetical protein
MRYGLIFLWMLLCPLTSAFAQLSINFAGPGVSIGVNLPVYPSLERVPGYPVYYAPGVNSNYFFYDGMYWVFSGDNWYASSWYNGPWYGVDPYDVPLYVLRVPVRYYRHAPVYFKSWRADASPHWGEHWGGTWEQRRSGWDHWDHNAVPAPAPLPTYQRQYSGKSYPQVQQQAAIQVQSYRYQPKDPVAQQHFQQRAQAVPAQQRQPAERQTQQAPVAREQQVAKPAQQAPATREQQAAKPPQPQPQQQHERTPQPAPPAHEQQAGRPQPQQGERQPQQAPVAHEQQAAKPQQQPHQAERNPQPAPPAHEQQAPKGQAQENAPHGKEQGSDKGNKEKDSKEKEKDNKGG